MQTDFISDEKNIPLHLFPDTDGTEILVEFLMNFRGFYVEKRCGNFSKHVRFTYVRKREAASTYVVYDKAFK